MVLRRVARICDLADDVIVGSSSGHDVTGKRAERRVERRVEREKVTAVAALLVAAAVSRCMPPVLI